MQEIIAKTKVQLELDLPFVLYKKPNETQIVGFFQENDHLYLVEKFSEKGFVMAPFDDLESVVLFPEKHNVIIVENNFPSIELQQPEAGNTEVSLAAKMDFELLVKKSIDAINKGMLLKVVVSRKEKIKLQNFDCLTYFQKLTTLYPTAFAYCWYHPKVGLWMGATPEKLIATQGTFFHSMSLAGTRNVLQSDDKKWEFKEKEEQKFVTDYILENLKSITTEVSVSSPYTIKAGNLLHIKTDIEGRLKKESNLKNVINILHPTPAVCGLPKLLAKEFILENEVSDRKYYTGFLGELNKNFSTDSPDSSDLYVNLRCMEIKNNTATVHVGCGITKNSIPEKEWEETVNKTQTMKMVIYSEIIKK